MDHDAVVRLKMTERYLLGELDPDARDEFEEHFFDCPNCALDVRAGALFVEQSKVVLAERSEPLSARLPVTAPIPAKPGWFAWLRPALVCSCNGLVAGCDRVPRIWFTYPHMRQGVEQPAGPVMGVSECRHVGIWRPVVPVRPGEAFLLFVRIPPDGVTPITFADLYILREGWNGRSRFQASSVQISGQSRYPERIGQSAVTLWLCAPLHLRRSKESRSGLI